MSLILNFPRQMVIILTLMFCVFQSAKANLTCIELFRSDTDLAQSPGLLRRATRSTIRATTGYDIGTGLDSYGNRVNLLSRSQNERAVVEVEMNNIELPDNQIVDSSGRLLTLQVINVEGGQPQTTYARTTEPVNRNLKTRVANFLEVPIEEKSASLAAQVAGNLKHIVAESRANDVLAQFKGLIDRVAQNETGGMSYNRIFRDVVGEIDPGGILGLIVGDQFFNAATRSLTPTFRSVEDFSRYLDSIPGRNAAKKRILEAARARVNQMALEGIPVKSSHQLNFSVVGSSGITISMRVDVIMLVKIDPQTKNPYLADIAGVKWENDYTNIDSSGTDANIWIGFRSGSSAKATDKTQREIDGAYALMMRNLSRP